MTTQKTKPKFRTNYHNSPTRTKLKTTTRVTVPGQALTNSQHIKQAKMGISDKTVKLIYDPNDIYPNVKAMDLVDQRKAIQGARALVADLREKAKDHEKTLNEIKAKKEEQAKIDQEKLTNALLEKHELSKLKNKQA